MSFSGVRARHQGAGAAGEDLDHVHRADRHEQDHRGRRLPAHVRRRDPASGTLAELAPSLVDALRALVPDGRRDHALRADRPATPGAVHARLDVRVAVAELGDAGRRRWRERRLIHVNGHGTGRGCERRNGSGRQVRLVLVRIDVDHRIPEPGNVVQERRSYPLGDVVSAPRTEMWGGTSIAELGPELRVPPSVPSPPRRARRRGRRRRRLDQAHRGLVDAVEHAAEHHPRGGHEREADRDRDEQAHDRVGSREAGQHADRAGHDPERRQAVGPRVVAVRDQRRRCRSPCRRGCGRSTRPRCRGTRSARAEHTRRARASSVSQPVDGLDGGEHGRRGDHGDDRESRQVLGAVEP